MDNSRRNANDKNIFHRILGFCAERQESAVLVSTALMVLLAGIWTARQAGQLTDLRMRRDLVRQAAAVAATINPSYVKALSFTADDKNRPEFRQLCKQMRAYAEQTGLHSLYTMVLQDGEFVFGPESLPEGHPEASPPGTVYRTPDPRDFDLFETGMPQVQGPRTDEYGTFVTATVPVFDPYSGEVLAAVGIDVEAAVWQSAVRQAQWVPGKITLAFIGVLLISGLILRYRRHRSPHRHERVRHAETILSSIFMSLLTVVLAVHFQRQENEARRNTFYALAQTHASTCAKEFYELNSRLEQLVYFFESGQEVTRKEFSRYCNSMTKSGILEACVWLPAVADEELAVFTQNVRAKGFPGFSVWQRNSAGTNEPASSRPVHYPALYIEPLAGHKAGLGHDFSSEPLRSKAIQEALITGWTSATDPVRLLAVSNNPPGLFIFRNVNAAVQKGLVAFAIRPENLLGGAQYHNRKDLGLDICLFELGVGREPVFMAGSSGQCGIECLNDLPSGLEITFPVFRFGKAYALRMIPDSAWLASHPLQHGKIAGLVGLLITLLFSSVITLITNRRMYLEKQIKRRTAELRASEERFRDITLNSSDWMWEIDTQGKYSYVSENVTALLGYTPQELIGRHPLELMPSGQAAESGGFFDALLKSRTPFRDYENWNLRKDGTPVCLLTSGVPMFSADGTFCGYRGTGTDKTARRQAEEELKKKYEEIDRFNKISVGRELRMIKLKKQVNELSQLLGRPRPYALDFLQHDKNFEDGCDHE